MAAPTNKCHVLFIYSAFFATLVFISSASSQCVDGEYKHEDRTCCMCAKGLKLVEHCKENLKHGKCEPCDEGTFSSHPGNEKTCDQCTDCSHHEENLKFERVCTAFEDAKCGCKEDHYCISGTESCRLCHPCKNCDPVGIKTHCAGHNDTVCNQQIEQGSRAEIIAPVVVIVVLVLGLTLVGLVFWKMRNVRIRELLQRRPKKPDNQDTGLLPSVKDVDIEPLIPDIAEVLGWRDMQDVAMRSRMPGNAIEACKLNHPGDAEQQTLELLKVWVQREGRAAPQKLIDILRKSCKRAQEEKVMDILRKASEPSDQNSPDPGV